MKYLPFFATLFALIVFTAMAASSSALVTDSGATLYAGQAYVNSTCPDSALDAGGNCQIPLAVSVSNFETGATHVDGTIILFSTLFTVMAIITTAYVFNKREGFIETFLDIHPQ